MAKIKLTKGELKRQRDNLRQYYRYLPTLQLKKQQLQMEILHQNLLFDEKRVLETEKVRHAVVWAGLLSDSSVEIKKYLKPVKTDTSVKNIAGVDVPVFIGIQFSHAEYDLFSTPLWVDAGIDALRHIISIREEMGVIQEGIRILRGELRTTTQRVNLFEKVKIPSTKDTIRRIKIHIGDQMTNAVGRSKIAKKKIEALESMQVGL